MNSQKQIKARVGYIDLFRAFGILLMIMGHIKFGSYFDKWIHAFHMPIFFFISGLFYRRKENVLQEMGRKARSLLVPYVVFEGIQWLVLIFFIPEYNNTQTIIHIITENTFKIPIEKGTFGISPIPGAMWFLTALFFTECIYLLIDRVAKTIWQLHLAVISLAIVGMIAPKFLPFRLPWALDVSLVGVGLFHCGVLIHNTSAKVLLDLKLWRSLVLVALITVSIMLSPTINMRTGNYGLYFPFWINALGAIIAGLNIFKYLDAVVNKNRILKCITVWFKRIGINSIVYLCFNQIVILSVSKVIEPVGVNTYFAKGLILLFTMMILWGIERLICETKMRVILGRH